jgi:hypothetical protein
VCDRSDAARSDTTKDRLVSMYRFPDKVLTPDVLMATVLELVKHIQAGLGICGMFEPASDERQGLLCEATVEGLQRWIVELGQPFVDLEVSVARPALGRWSNSAAYRTRRRSVRCGRTVQSCGHDAQSAASRRLPTCLSHAPPG